MDFNMKQKMKKIREYYELSQKSMSIICGFGENTWRKYEKNGFENANKSNKLLVKSTFRPSSFIGMLKNTKASEIPGYHKAFEKAEEASKEIEMKAFARKMNLEDRFVDTIG